MLRVACIAAGYLFVFLLPLNTYAQQPEQQPCFDARVDQPADLDSRITDCMRVIGDTVLAPDVRAAAHLRRALAFVQKAGQSKQKEDLDRALADLAETMRLLPDNPAKKEIYQLRASLYFHNGDYDKALTDYSSLISADPNSPTAYDYRGYVYATKGQHDQAIADYTEAIRLDPNNSRRYAQRAWSYLQSAKAAEGLGDANRALGLDPNDAATYGTRALIYRSLGKKSEAVDDFRKAISLDPTNTALREELQKAEPVATATAPSQPPPPAEMQSASATTLSPKSSAEPAHPTAAAFSSSRSSVPLSSTEEAAVRPKDSFKECEACPEMILAPVGDFKMGSDQGDDDEKPERKVTISKPIAVSRFEATFAQWDACLSDGGCKHKPEDKGWGRGDRPVINVSWDDVTKEYLPWLSQKTGKQYRLLTEAEWEYVARAGSSNTRYIWGDDIGQGHANCDGCGSQWDNKQTAPVGSFAANLFGVHDMYGNVWEWVADCYKGTYAKAPTDGSAPAETQGCSRSRRGGAWYNKPDKLRATFRGRSPSSQRLDIYGFRVARTLAH